MRRAQLVGFLFLFLGLCSPHAYTQIAADISFGTHVSEVVQRYGWPKSKLSTGDKEIFIYDGFEVTFEDDKVIKVMAVASRPKPKSVPPKPPAISNPRPPSKAPSSSETTSRSAPKTATAPRQSVGTIPPTTVKPTTAKFEQPAKPVTSSPANAAAPKPDIFAIWRRLIWFPVIAIAGVVVAKLAIASIRNRSQLTEQLLGGDVAPPAKIRTELTLELLDRLEWKRFENLVCLYYRALGQRAELTGIGADGGVDIKLYEGNAILPTTYVQCKAWGSRDVDVKPIRELFGVMSADRVLEGLFITTGRYTASAMAFARGNGIQLISGADFIRMFSGLPIEQQIPILTEVTSGDFTTPSCPSCNIKLVLRSEGKFWGCRNYPRCKTRIYVRRAR